MKSPLMRIVLVIVFAVATLGVSTASAQSTCKKGCNEAFRKAMHDCRGVTPRAKRRKCEVDAQKAHRQCLRGCRAA
jgi:hypothetical protein